MREYPLVRDFNFIILYQVSQSALLRCACKGQFPIPSVSIGKIHSSSLTLIWLTLQWDTLVYLNIIPSIVCIFIRLICLYFKWNARTHNYNVLPTFAITWTLEKVTWLKGGNNIWTIQGTKQQREYTRRCNTVKNIHEVIGDCYPKQLKAFL